MDASRLGLLSPSPSPVIPRTHLGSLGLNSVSIIFDQARKANSNVSAVQVHQYSTSLPSQERDDLKTKIVQAIPDKVLATANREYSKEREKHEFDQCLKYLKRQLLYEHDLWYLFPRNMENHSLPVSVELDAKVTSISGNSNTIPIEDTPHSGSGAPSDVLKFSTKAMIASKRPVLLVDQSNISDIELDKSHFFSLDEGSADSTFTDQQVTIRSGRLLERRSKMRKVSKKSDNFDYDVASPRATNHIKKINKSLDSKDPLSLFLRGPETKQLLTIKEEIDLFTQIEDLMRLEDIKERLQLQTQREPTLSEWAQAVGMSCHGLQSCLSSGRHSRDKMISANLRLVVHVARQYEGKGLDLQDLLQEGSKGLMKSFEKFKPGAGSRFPSYAYWWIRHSIKRAIFLNSRTIRIPENAFALLKNIKNARRLCIQEGHLPTNEEVAKRVGITVDKLESVLLNTRIPVSIEGRPWSDHDATFQEIVADPAIESPDLAIAKQMMRLHVHSLLKVLKPKEKAIIQLQFGIHSDGRKSLSQIGAMYGLSKERIRQIGNQALKKLKTCLLTQGLEAYLELLT
ncbi:RNA polymerase sigma factor sigF, chloroplastic [Curcuma longa]|uniref:RNA polymerase sigma factor sigF, chloroplastic n=1 Tax=Curcuma longa TaxID=136217 RepID=UPI003D9E531D